MANGDRAADCRDDEAGIVWREGDLARAESRLHQRPALASIGATPDTVAGHGELAAHGGHIVQTSERNPIVNQQKENLETLESQQDFV